MRAALLLLDELGLIENSARLIPKADRKKIHEYIFREGVLVAKKSVLSLRIGRNGEGGIRAGNILGLRLCLETDLFSAGTSTFPSTRTLTPRTSMYVH